MILGGPLADFKGGLDWETKSTKTRKKWHEKK